jgi:hypothetical protein
MTFQEFLDKWNGQPVDFDGHYGNQCVDLYRKYCEEVLKIPQSPPVAYASQIWDTYLKEFFTAILNTPEGIPTYGDIMIWEGDPGHVSLFIEGTTGSFRSFDVNWPKEGYTDSNGNFIGTGVCHVQGHTYSNVLGWLHFKGNTDYYKEIDLNNKDSIKVCVDVWADVVKNGLYVKKEEFLKLQEAYRTEKGVLEGRITDERKRYNDFLAKLAKELDTTQDEPAIMEEIDRLIKSEDKVVNLETRVSELEGQLEESKKGVTTRDEQIAGLRRDLAALQARKLAEFPRLTLLLAAFAKRGDTK